MRAFIVVLVTIKTWPIMLHNQDRPYVGATTGNAKYIYIDYYTGTGVVSVKFTELPDNVTHIVNGSLPSCSVVKP
jgi:hypothetical protein